MVKWRCLQEFESEFETPWGVTGVPRHVASSLLGTLSIQEGSRLQGFVDPLKNSKTGTACLGYKSVGIHSISDKEFCKDPSLPNGFI